VQLTVATLPRVRWEPREPSPKRLGPVKGTCGLEPRRLPSCSDMTASPRSWSAPCESGVFRVRHGVPIRPISAAARVSAICGFLRARCRRFATRPPTFVEDRLEAYSTKIRPTDFCHPTEPVYLYPRSWLSSCLSPPGFSPAAQRIEGHDVSRRRRPLPPDPTTRCSVVRRGRSYGSSF